jgi:hypothetical protein
MLRVVGCWKWCEVGISVEGNELRAEGWDTCPPLESVLSCFCFVLVTLGTGGEIYWWQKHLNAIRLWSLEDGVKQVCSVREKISHFRSYQDFLQKTEILC